MIVGSLSLALEVMGSMSAFEVSPLFTDVVPCLGTPLLEIKKSTALIHRVLFLLSDVITVVYLFLMSYGRSRPDQINMVIPNFLQVCYLLLRSDH